MAWLLPLCLATLPTAPSGFPTPPPMGMDKGLSRSESSTLPKREAARQFDFWIGEWSVQNRHLQDDLSWRNGDQTRARITPVCGGMALLEEWAGPFRGTFMNGFSLRSYEPRADRWTILLFWTVDGNGAFGRMHGSFRHGRGEFFNTNEGTQRTRYTFSDALPTTVRWDQATTQDGGATWRTDWIMEFSRTRSAEETTQDRFFTTPWTEGQLSPHPRARRMDFLLGQWTGQQTLADGTEREARLRCKWVNRDCLVVDLLENRVEGESDWNERLCVRAFEPGRGAWTCWSLSEEQPTMQRSEAEEEEGLTTFVSDSPTGRIERIEQAADGSLLLTVTQATPDGEEPVSSTWLTRAE